MSPAANGRTVLQKTVQNVLEAATGDIEVLVGFDGKPFQDLPDDKRVMAYYNDERRGIKSTINWLAAMANGKYLFKLDGHCSVAKGFDEVLQANMEENWLVMPRFYVLNEMTWQWQDDRHYDYFYLSCPFTDPRGIRFKAGGHWPELTKLRETNEDLDIDETPQIHGSGWFCTKDYFLNKLKGFQDWGDPLGHAQEPPYLGLKTWLGPWGGQVMVNKKTWYAHMHKGPQHDRGFRYTNDENEKSYRLAADFFLRNQWEERAHDFEWFVDKFMPMPTWPDNWKEVYHKWLQS